jgi:hypothetical protein
MRDRGGAPRWPATLRHGGGGGELPGKRTPGKWWGASCPANRSRGAAVRVKLRASSDPGGAAVRVKLRASSTPGGAAVWASSPASCDPRKLKGQARATWQAAARGERRSEWALRRAAAPRQVVDHGEDSFFRNFRILLFCKSFFAKPLSKKFYVCW